MAGIYTQAGSSFGPCATSLFNICFIMRSLLILVSPIGALAAAPYSTWMADSVIARGDGSATAVSYETGVVQKSFEVRVQHLVRYRYAY